MASVAPVMRPDSGTYEKGKGVASGPRRWCGRFGAPSPTSRELAAKYHRTVLIGAMRAKNTLGDIQTDRWDASFSGASTIGGQVTTYKFYN